MLQSSRKQGNEEVEDGQHLLGFITDSEELLLRFTNIYKK
jgi:hypothetical protein